MGKKEWIGTLIAVLLLTQGIAVLGRSMGWCTYVQPSMLRDRDGFTGSTGCLMEMAGLQSPPGEAGEDAQTD